MMTSVELTHAFYVDNCGYQGVKSMFFYSFRVAQASIPESEEPVSQVCNVNDMPDKDLDIEGLNLIIRW